MILIGYRIFWHITHTVYNPHRHKNVKFSKQIVVLPAPTDNPQPKQLLLPFCIITLEMAAKLILITHFTNVILVYSTIICLL